MALYKNSLRENSENADAMLALGAASVRTGNYHDAESNLLNAEKYFLKSALLQNNLSVLYLKIKDYDNAIAHMNKLLELQPRDVEVQYNIAMANFAKGNRHETLELLKSILATHPEHRNSMIAVELITNNKLNM